MPEKINLSTDRLLIRDLTWDDLDFVHSLHSIPEVQKYATIDIPKSLTESIDYITKYIEEQRNCPRRDYGLCICLTNQKPIGLIGLSNSLNKFKSAELWFKIQPEFGGEVILLKQH
jgi:RimJ/RimL family protein N-acetyltransferase